MKKDSTPISRLAQSETPSCGSRSARTTVNQILKTAYRRHTRGKVALAAMMACLGR